MRVTAKDLMQDSPMTVSADARLIDAHRLFVEEEIHGAPVVDEQDHVVGVVSVLDVVRALTEEIEEHTGRVSAYFHEDVPFINGESTRLPDELEGHLADQTVSEVMTREVVSVRPDALVKEVAALMLEQRIHRVLVVENRELRGIVTTFDLLQLLH